MTFIVIGIGLILVLAWAFVALGASGPKAGSEPSAVRTPNEFLLGEAKIHAQVGLERFIASLQANGSQSHWVKVPLPTPDGSSEHIWVGSLQVEAGEWKGKLSNKPINLPDLSLGSDVSFRSEDIEDWMIRMNNGTIDGQFSKAAVDEVKA